MEKSGLQILVDQYLSGAVNNEQQSALLEELLSASSRSDLEEIMHAQYTADIFTGDEDDLRREKLFGQILAAKKENSTPINDTVRRLPFMRKWGWAAAVIFLCVSTYFLFVEINKHTRVQVGQAGQRNDIPPGKVGAVLTLANGTQIALDSLGNGHVATQNGMNVQLTDGRLAYDSPASIDNAQKELVYNELSTPKGRQFQLVLPDGTKVWLNAASSIKYPVTFDNKVRKVEISGEAYFEVMPFHEHKELVPFIVQTKKQQIQVLGTSFNINAYDDEKVEKTTLVTGSVRIVAEKEEDAPAGHEDVTTAVLRPGQQAIVNRSTRSGNRLSIKDYPGEAAIAWKNGAFNFEELPLEEAMRQLERWYDIQVVYENGVPDIHFGGAMDRNVSLADLTSLLETTKLKFRIEDNRKLVIMR